MQAVQQTAVGGRVSKTGIAPPTMTRYDGFDRMPIGGVWRAGTANKVEADRDPYTGETLVEIPLAGASDLDEAYRTAQHAQRAWAATLPQERRDVLEGAAQLMVLRKGELVDWLIKESGSTRAKAELERGMRVAKRLEAGMTHVNDWPVDDEPNTAFGGEKASGLGRFGGQWALEEFTTDHWISVQMEARQYPI